MGGVLSDKIVVGKYKPPMIKLTKTQRAIIVIADIVGSYRIINIKTIESTTETIKWNITSTTSGNLKSFKIGM